MPIDDKMSYVFFEPIKVNNFWLVAGRFSWTYYVLQDMNYPVLSSFASFQGSSRRYGSHRFKIFFLTRSWIITFNKHVSTSKKAMKSMKSVLIELSGWSFQNQFQVIFIRSLGEDEAIHVKVEILESLHKAHLWLINIWENHFVLGSILSHCWL